MGLVLLVAMVLVAMASRGGAMAVPARPFGVLVSSLAVPSSASLVEVFVDPQCPDSAAAFPVLRQAWTRYSAAVQFRLFLFPLPYHRWSFAACSAVLAVAELGGDFVAALALALANQKVLFNSVSNMTVAEVVRELYDKVAMPAGVAAALPVFADKTAQLGDNVTRQWKWAIANRRVFGTPSFAANGVALPEEAQSWTLKQWETLLDTLKQ